VRVWEAGSGRLLHTLTGHTGGVTAVAWSPDGTRLVSGGDDARLVLWSLHTLNPELYLQLEALAALSGPTRVSPWVGSTG
jgi:WD40 repeat protein